MDDNDDMASGEVFRFCRGADVRIYHIRVVPGGIELWRVTVRHGEPDSSIKEDHFQSADAAAAFFEEIERTLTAGGWRPVSRD